ncbi:MAG: hypothetical protein WC544_01055 [Patescibacteria group bacterium]
MDTASPQKMVQRARLQLWLGLGGIIVVGLVIAVYFIFLKTPSENGSVVAKGLDDPRCQTWDVGGGCAEYSNGGAYFDPQTKKCQEFSGGAVCTQPPFVSAADCETVCIRGEADAVPAVDQNSNSAHEHFTLDCTLPSGTFTAGDGTGALPDSSGLPVGLGRCHVANADANTLHILLLWQVFIDGEAWYSTDMRFADPVTAGFAQEVPIASGYDNGVFDYTAKFSRTGDYRVVFSIYDCTDVEDTVGGLCANWSETKNADIVSKATPIQTIEKTFTVQ